MRALGDYAPWRGALMTRALREDPGRREGKGATREEVAIRTTETMAKVVARRPRGQPRGRYRERGPQSGSIRSGGIRSFVFSEAVFCLAFKRSS